MKCPRCDSKDTVGFGCVGMDAMKYDCVKCKFEWKDWSVKFIDMATISEFYINGVRIK